MRIMTPEQFAQVKEALDTACINDPLRDDGYYADALAVLELAPDVEVVGYVYGVMTDSCTRRSMATIQADIELKSGAPLYAIKKETP